MDNSNLSPTPQQIPPIQAQPTIPVVKPKTGGADFGKALLFLGVVTILSIGLYIIAKAYFPEAELEEIIGKWDCGRHYIEGVGLNYTAEIENDSMTITRVTDSLNYEVTTEVNYDFLKKYNKSDSVDYIVQLSKIKVRSSDGENQTKTPQKGYGIIFNLDNQSKELSFQADDTTLNCKRSD